MTAELPVQSSAFDRVLTPQEKVDVVQFELAQLPQHDFPLKHVFTPGLYTRTIFMPAGSVIVSKIHKTEHPFVISQGRASVWTEEEGWVELAAPYLGVTTPGTRRILRIHEDCVWSTFHPTAETDLEKLEAVLIEPRDVEPFALAALEKIQLEGCT